MKLALTGTLCLILAAPLTSHSAKADENVVSDTALMDKAAADLPDPESVLDYEVVDPSNGKTQGTGTVEVHPAPGAAKGSDEVVVVTKDQSGNVQVVKRESKTYVSSKFGEGYSWWDVGFGMYAGSLSSEVLKPANAAPGRTMTNFNGTGGIDVSFAIRPRIWQQRLTIGVDFLANGCNGTMNGVEAAPNDGIMNGQNCHLGREVNGEVAVYRSGQGDGKHHEIAVGVTYLTDSFDHVDPTVPGSPNGGATTETHKSFIMPEVTYRFWTGGFLHPQIRADIGNGAVVIHFNVRFSMKKKVARTGTDAYNTP